MEPMGSQGRYRPRTAPMAGDDPVVQWLLRGDPAIRWQVLRDLLDAPGTAVAAERARVEHEGWGARLLALRAPDGLWAGGACVPQTAGCAAGRGGGWGGGWPPAAVPAARRGTGRGAGRRVGCRAGAAVDRDVPGPA